MYKFSNHINKPDYEIIKPLGKGAFGKQLIVDVINFLGLVFLANDKKQNKKVAWKRI